MNKSIQEINDYATVKMSKHLYEETEFRTEMELVFNHYVDLTLDLFDFETLEIESKVQQKLNEIFDDQIIYGYAIFTHAKTNGFNIAEEFDTRNLDEIKFNIPNLIEALIDGNILNDTVLPSTQQNRKYLIEELNMTEEVINELIKVATCFGFYQAVQDFYKEKFITLNTTFKETKIGGHQNEIYIQSPLHFLSLIHETEHYEVHQIEIWNAINKNEPIYGQLTYYKDFNELEIKINNKFYTKHVEMLINHLLNNFDEIDTPRVNIMLVSDFLILQN